MCCLCHYDISALVKSRRQEQSGAYLASILASNSRSEDPIHVLVLPILGEPPPARFYATSRLYYLLIASFIWLVSLALVLRNYQPSCFF